MFRNFKRHYHKVKKVFSELTDSNSFDLNINFKDGRLSAVNTIPTGEETVQFVVLMRRFLSPPDILYYKNIWVRLKDQFSNEIPASDVENIEKVIERLTKGYVSIKINNDELTAEKIYGIISEGGYFTNVEEIKKYLKSLSDTPLVGPLLWHQFYAYTLEGFKLVSTIFDLILRVEQSDKYKSIYPQTTIKKKLCIYCLETNASFTSEEHIFPESLGNDTLILVKGMVCDKCNNGILSQLDSILLSFEPIAMLQVLFVPYTKSGQLPKANFQNMTVQKTHPNYLKITAKDKTGCFQNERHLGDDWYAFNLKLKGKKFIPNRYGRSLYKIALGFVAYDRGLEEACSVRYNKARDFISKGNDFNNNLLIKMETKPHPQVEVTHHSLEVGTPFVIDIYGIIFLLNLEEEPKLELNEELSRLKFSSFPLSR